MAAAARSGRGRRWPLGSLSTRRRGRGPLPPRRAKTGRLMRSGTGIRRAPTTMEPGARIVNCWHDSARDDKSWARAWMRGQPSTSRRPFCRPWLWRRGTTTAGNLTVFSSVRSAFQVDRRCGVFASDYLALGTAMPTAPLLDDYFDRCHAGARRQPDKTTTDQPLKHRERLRACILAD